MMTPRPHSRPHLVQTSTNALSAFQKIQKTGGFRTAAVTLLVILGVTVMLLVAVPWQQSVSGVGQVSVFLPMDRPQTVEAPISGRISHWYVQEGESVQEGQLLVELAEIDPKYLAVDQLDQLKAQKEATQARKNAAESRIESLKSQIRYLQQSRGAAIPSAGAKRRQANAKIQAAEQAVRSATQDNTTAELNLKRLQMLYDKGLRSQRDRELAEQKWVKTQAKLEQAQAKLDVALQDQTVAGFEQTKVVADTAASLSSAQASLAKAYEELAYTTSDLAKIRVELANLSARVDQRQIKAPKAGIVVRVMNVGAGETVAEGEPLVRLMPQDADLAVELLISDNDAPLVAVGRPVRLQFAGWPALQFSGWPAVAVGTFAGRVSVVDAIDDGTNRYRVWVKSDEQAVEDGQDQPWPSVQYLRPGSEALGWIMLDTVPLWFELWRQFNAFPPTVDVAPIKDKAQELKTGPSDDIKKPKKK